MPGDTTLGYDILFSFLKSVGLVTKWSHTYEKENDRWICKATLVDSVRSKSVWSHPLGTKRQARDAAYDGLLPYVSRQIKLYN